MSKLIQFCLVCLVLLSANVTYGASGLEQAEKIFDSRNYDKAEKYYRVLLRNDKNNSHLLLRIAQCEAFLGKSARSFITVNQALELDARLTNAYVLRAQLYSVKGDFIRARIDFQTAIVQEPENKVARVGLANTLDRLGDPEGARAHYDILQGVKNTQ